MAQLLVTYDLRAPDRNYKPVDEYLQRVGRRALESVWVVDTAKSPGTIR
jgi:hypothetical protein